MKKPIKVIIAVVLAVAVLFGVSAWYVSDYYRADYTADSSFIIDDTISTGTIDGKTVKTVYSPADPESAIIFYPGGKVEHTAYEPLMRACASKGIMCILVEMPFNLAVFDINAANGIRENYPQIKHWYVGGHSLGGSMAASYISKNAEYFDGLILLGSYSTVDLTMTNLKALTVYGSEDKILNKEEYNINLLNLPVGYREEVIEGGCHAYFGMYGAQDGDGTPTISNEEQIKITADIIADFINI